MTTKRRLRDHLATNPHLVFRQEGSWFQINVMAGRHSLQPGFPTAAFTQDPDSLLLFVNDEELEVFLEDSSIPLEIRTYLRTVRPYSQSIDALTLQEFGAIIHADFQFETTADEPLATPIEALEVMLGSPGALQEINGHMSAVFGDTGRTGRRHIMAQPVAMFHHLRALRTREHFGRPGIAVSEGLLESSESNISGGGRFVRASELQDYNGSVMVKAKNGTYLRAWAFHGDIEFRHNLRRGSLGRSTTFIKGNDSLWSSSVVVNKGRPMANRDLPLDVLAAGG